MKPQIKGRDMEFINDVLQMGDGYVLNFSDRTFTSFFRDEFDVDIDADAFKVEGTSKAKRLRCFLQTTPPPLVGRVLQRLLEHRLNEVDSNVASATLSRFRALAGELSTGSGIPSAPVGKREQEALALQAGDVLDERLARRRLVVERVESQDARWRDHVLKRSEHVAEECKRTNVRWCSTTNLTLSEVGDEQVYGFLAASPEGLSISYRTTSEDVDDAYNGIHERTYHFSSPGDWPVEWLRAIFEQGKLDELDKAIDAKLLALVDQASPRQGNEKGDVATHMGSVADANLETPDRRPKRKGPLTVAAAIGHTYVLAVGVSDYERDSGYGRLRQCDHDAAQVANAFRTRPELRSSAASVSELTSTSAERPSRSKIIRLVRELAGRANEEDRIIFYFSGHGQLLDKQLYLVPNDAWTDNDANLLISLGAVNEYLSKSQAKIKIVILDACNTGPDLAGLKHGAGQWSDKFLAEYIQKSAGVVTLASSLAEQLSSTKSPNPNLSLFTNFVVKALLGEIEAQDNGLLTIQSLFEYVSVHVQRVSTSYHRPQQPAMSVATSGMIVLGDFRESHRAQPFTEDNAAKSEQAEQAKGAPVARLTEIPESLSRVLGFLVESTDANGFHWSKELQHAATLQEQEAKLRDLNGAISARTYKIRPLHKKAVIEGAHETLDTLQALTNSAATLSAKHGLLWVSITKTVKQLAGLFPYHPSESDNEPRLLVDGSDAFSLHFSELMAQLLQFLDGAAGVGIKPAPETAYAVTAPFEPLTARVVSRQTQGALVVPALWRISATPAVSKKWTRAKVYNAISASIPNTNGGTEQLTRWPVVLRPGSLEYTRDDGTYVWRIEENGSGQGERHEEQLGLGTDGSLWFQRAHFWDAPPAQTVLELGRCAHDVIVFLKLLIGVGNQLGITSYGVDLCVEAPQPEMVATINGKGLVAKQPLLTARTHRRKYDAHVEVGPMTSLPDSVQVKLVQELVDGIANELTVEPLLFQQGGKRFLEIEESSIEAVLRTFRGTAT